MQVIRRKTPKIIEVEGDMSRICGKCKPLGDYDNTFSVREEGYCSCQWNQLT